MRRARCTLDNITYTSVDFDQTDDFANKRRSLVCTDCGGPAFYRGPTRNGREACFGARHTDGCELATLAHDGAATGQGGDEDEILTTGQRIIVDFNFGAPATDFEAQPTGVQTDTANQRGHNGEGIAVRQFMYRRLRPILHALITNDAFRRSPEIIELPGQGEFVTADLFVNFTDVTEDHVGTFHGYWGIIHNLQPEDNTLWFNSGGNADMSVLLDSQHSDEFYERYGTNILNEFVRAYMLVFGELRLGPTGKKYVVIEALQYVAMKLELMRNQTLIQNGWEEPCAHL